MVLILSKKCDYDIDAMASVVSPLHRLNLFDSANNGRLKYRLLIMAISLGK